MKLLSVIAACTATVFASAPASAQLLKKLQQKVETKVETKADQEIDKQLGLNQNQNQNQGQNQNQNQGQNQNQNGNGGMNGNNTGGGLNQNNTSGGLISTPPDVNANLADGATAYKGGKYGEARYSIQQAMLGVELEIGNKILKSLPETISGLPKDVTADQVTSTGSGWAGLTIARKYSNTNGKEFRTTIANNSVWMSALNMYFTSGGYAQQTNGQQNWKQVKVKGNRAIIEFEQSSGYKLSVPIGQSSLIVFEGVNFANENDMMAAANSVDIDGIKKMLGEQ